MIFDNIIVAPCLKTLNCTEGQYEKDGTCQDCFTPAVSISASFLSIAPGQLVEIIWGSTVPDVDASVVTLEYGAVVETLVRNVSTSKTFTPGESTTYTIRAVTPCGTVTAVVTVAVNAVVPCVVPDGLPTCLSLDIETPSEVFSDCPLTLDTATSETLWAGDLPFISAGRWGYEFPNDIYILNEGIFGYKFSPILEFVSCDPLLYRLTLYIMQDGVPFVAWQGEAIGNIFGPYISLNHSSEIGCSSDTDFSLKSCESETCTAPTVRFDPPASSRVSFPSLVFIHASIPGSAIYYGINDEGPIHLYEGPVTLAIGQEISAMAIGPDNCVGVTTPANYVVENGLEFDFVCDGPNDKAGVFGVFAPNGVSNDYHWRIRATRIASWVLHSAKIYETDSAGVWVTGQAWATLSPIYPVELSPDPFAVYPLVLFNGASQLNSVYADPVGAAFPVGLTMLNGYGQPFVPLVGYFRLEFNITQSASTYTIYKLISHACSACADVATPILTAGCDGTLTFSGVVQPGGRYRVSKSIAAAPYAVVADSISVSGVVSFVDTGTVGVSYSFILSEYCVATDSWIDSAPVSAVVPKCCIENTPDPATLFIDIASDAGVTNVSGTVTAWDDASPEDNDPLIVGAPQLIANQLNGHPAIRFDGVDDAATTAAFPYCGAFTLMGVLKQNVATSQQFLDLNNLLQLESHTDGRLKVFFNNRLGGVVIAATPSTIPFYFVMIYNCGNIKLWFYDVLLMNTSTPFNPSYFTTISIGKTIGGFGAIDVFRIRGWRGIRTTAQIAADIAALKTYYGF